MKPTRIWIILVLSLTLVFLVAPTGLAQPPVPHVEKKDGVSYENCITCHRTGQEDAPLMPADHAYHENDDCRSCHPPPSSILHPIAGWEDCRGCHERWYSQRVDIPSLANSDHDHTAYTNDECTTCHRAYAESPVMCNVCHPKSATAKTLHNGPDLWVDCVDCHQAAAEYPHDLERTRSRNEDCTSCHREPYSLSTHVARGDLHVGIDCATCHLETATVERDPASGYTRVVLPGTEPGVPPDDPTLGVIVKEVDCQRCHVLDNRIAAPASALPPRSVLCLACHDASPIVEDELSWIGLTTFGLGMLMILSIWQQGAARGLQGLSWRARWWRTLVNFLSHFTTRRIFVFVRAFVVDGLLHKKLFHDSKLRWLSHTCMLFGMGARMTLGIFTWLMTVIAPVSPITWALVNKNSLAIAFIYDALGLAVVLGAALAVVRRYVIKDKQLITGGQDTIAIVLIGAIFSMGFIVEGARIITTDIPSNLAVYSFVGYLVSLALRLTPVNWSAVYGGLWYVHTGLVTALVAYLPFGKFMHVLISPIVTALNAAMKIKARSH